MSNAPLTAAFTALLPGEIRPLGWIRDQIQHDLSSGMIGHLDELVPDIFADDIFGADRRRRSTDAKATGSAFANGEDWEVELRWWNAETQGNWMDGYVRAARQAGDAATAAKADGLVRRLLAGQDADGYVGIYGPELRYRHTGENGELWAQAVALRTLLGHGDATSLAAARRAADQLIAACAAHEPFALINGWGGADHGLMVVDAFHMLFERTGERAYADMAVCLYRGFTGNRARNHDLHPQAIRDPMRRFEWHGAHLYEHLRALLLAWRHSGDAALERDWHTALAKLSPCILPSGAGIGFEDVEGATAVPDRCATEYCTMTELRNTWLAAVMHLGEARFADFAEQLTFNGLQGSRLPDGSALAYCMPDTCTCLDGHDPEGRPNRRYKMSPTQQDAAVCCVPNAGRVLPYFVDSMWARHAHGLAALLYGPCAVTTTVAGAIVEITCETAWPFSDGVTMRIRSDRPAAWTLRLRRPGWPGEVTVEAPGALRRDQPGWIDLHRTWEGEITVVLRCDFTVFHPRAVDRTRGVQRGPLVFALPIAHQREAVKSHPLPGFFDSYLLPHAGTDRPMAMPDAPVATVEHHALSAGVPWTQPSVRIRLPLHNPATGSEQEQVLEPIGAAPLRRVSFPAIDRRREGLRNVNDNPYANAPRLP